MKTGNREVLIYKIFRTCTDHSSVKISFADVIAHSNTIVFCHSSPHLTNYMTLRKNSILKCLNHLDRWWWHRRNQGIRVRQLEHLWLKFGISNLHTFFKRCDKCITGGTKQGRGFIHVLKINESTSISKNSPPPIPTYFYHSLLLRTRDNFHFPLNQMYTYIEVD